MRGIESWLSEYDASHEHVINKLVHWICVPAIIFSLLGLLWPLKMPAPLNTVLPDNWAITVVLVSLVYYFMLSLRLALGMVCISGGLLLFILWQICLGVFIGAWIGQFIGHLVEGKRPAFFKDLQFLMIGPLWLLAASYRRLHISY